MPPFPENVDCIIVQESCTIKYIDPNSESKSTPDFSGTEIDSYYDRSIGDIIL